MCNEASADERSASEAALNGASAARVPNPLPSARVLAVDDDARLRAMLVEYLRRNGFEVSSAGTCSAGCREVGARRVRGDRARSRAPRR